MFQGLIHGHIFFWGDGVGTFHPTTDPPRPVPLDLFESSWSCCRLELSRKPESKINLSKKMLLELLLCEINRVRSW